MGDEVWVVVRDTGIGIAPEDQASIFAEFRQAGRLSTSSREGTGLGLALAQKFVNLHGGRLWVESHMGVGSTFTFTLPARPASTGLDLLGAYNPGRSTAQAGEHDRTVLVVEDNSHAADLLRLYLEGGGFAVAPVRDGETALSLARELRPAAIVLDILLPGLDGWDVLALAKADPAIAHIPIVVVSMLDERGKGFALGAADYLVKPVQRDALLTTLRRAMRLPSGFEGLSRVVAIDEDPLALELIGAVLGAEGYIVLKATGGQEGIELIQREQPGLVILDLLMPDLDGFGVVERLRDDASTSGIPIVILTSRSMDAQERASLNGKVSHLASKATFNRAEFVKLVQKLCPVLETTRTGQGLGQP
jgi:CheY-like chemotaxis protein